MLLLLLSDVIALNGGDTREIKQEKYAELRFRREAVIWTALPAGRNTWILPGCGTGSHPRWWL